MAALAVGGGFYACGTEDPSRVDRPPVVQSYAPTGRALTAFLGDTLTFRMEAIDPDQDALATSFTVDGVEVSSTSAWRYAIVDTGLTTVRGSVTDGESSSYIEWTVESFRPVNLPPRINAALPVAPNPVIVIGTRLDFAVAATDPEAQALAYWFSVDDSVVAQSPQFSYLATSVGMKSVRAVVSDGERAVARSWALKVTEIPDTIAPALVNIVGVVPGDEPGQIVVDWIAVGRDDMIGTASEYQLRTAPEPIRTPTDWARASNRPRVPSPVPAGEAMHMVADELLPGRLTYIAVRASDDFGNLSPIGASPSVRIRGMSFSGHVRDALTGAGVANAIVGLGPVDAVTDAGGAYAFAELEPVTSSIVARDEGGLSVGAYYDYWNAYTVVHQDVLDFMLIPSIALGTNKYVDFLEFFRAMTDFNGNPFATYARRWELPVDLYVRPYTRDGLDYRATIEAVAGEFDALLGERVFNLLTTAPAVGVETVYRDGLAQDNYRVTEFTNDWYPRLGLIQFRTVYDAQDQVALARTARHELGHALGLNHSLDPLHLMIGGSQAPVVDAFTPDELAVLRVYYRLPRGSDTRQHIRD